MSRGRTLGRVPVAVATVVVVVGAMLLAGCSRSLGGDGSLTDDWPALAEPRPNVPPGHGCYTLDGRDPAAVPTVPVSVDCSLPHTVETVHVGTFPGDVAARPGPPAAGGPERRAAYRECLAKARDFLGGDSRASSYRLSMAVPQDHQWAGGGRWYRCDLYGTLDDGSLRGLQASLRGLMSRQPPGCYTATFGDDTVSFQQAVDCTVSHQAEFVGVFEAPDGAYPEDSTARDRLSAQGCRGLVAAYVSVPNDNQLIKRLGWSYGKFDKISWQLGDRGVRCHLTYRTGISRSLKGAGVKVLPVR